MRSRTRVGFTLIELMVAMALTLLIMAILSQAFAMALETFASLKGLGDMQQVLRTASVAIRSDLAADHFEGNRRLGDRAFWGGRPEAGFVVVRQSSALSASGPGYIDEGIDQNGVPAQRANDHFLYFTVRRKGNRIEDSFTATLSGNAASVNAFFGKRTAYNTTPANLAIVTLTPVGAGTYASQWAEVFYYLERTGSTEELNNPLSDIGTPTYALKRAQFAMVPDNTNLVNQFANTDFGTFAALSCSPGGAPGNMLEFNTPMDAAKGKRIIPNVTGIPTPTQPALLMPQPPLSDPPVTVLEQQLASGSTLLVPNVISFQVQIMPSTTAAFFDMPAANGIYDTTQFGVAGANTFGLKAIQITIRVFDPKTRQTRQTTIIQDV